MCCLNSRLVGTLYPSSRLLSLGQVLDRTARLLWSRCGPAIRHIAPTAAEPGPLPATPQPGRQHAHPAPGRALPRPPTAPRTSSTAWARTGSSAPFVPYRTFLTSNAAAQHFHCRPACRRPGVPGRLTSDQPCVVPRQTPLQHHHQPPRQQGGPGSCACCALNGATHEAVPPGQQRPPPLPKCAQTCTALPLLRHQRPAQPLLLLTQPDALSPAPLLHDAMTTAVQQPHASTHTPPFPHRVPR